MLAITLGVCVSIVALFYSLLLFLFYRIIHTALGQLPEPGPVF